MDADEPASLFPPEPDPAFTRFRDVSRFWIQRVFLPMIGTVGVLGNFATILVLTRRGMRTSTNAYLTALAVADLIYLICVLWLSLRHYPDINENHIWSFIYSNVWPYTVWLADATTNTSVWLTVTFTVERCIAITYPIKGRVLCTVSKAKRAIISIYLICFITTVTTPFEWTVEEKMDPSTNTSTFEVASSHLGEMKIYQTIYYWFTSIAFVLLPLTLLIIFNSFLIHSFHQSQKLRRTLTAQQVSERGEKATSQEIKMTGTLITVVIMFLVCQLPTAATLIYDIFHVTKLNSNEEAVLRALGNIFNFLVSLNAACNFILYCALSSKYRRTFMSTFCRFFYQRSRKIYSKALFARKMLTEEPKNEGKLFTSRRHFTFSRRANVGNALISSQKPDWIPADITPIPNNFHRKLNCYVLALPVISENGSSSDIFPASNPSQTVSIQHHDHCPLFFTALPCHGSSQSLPGKNISSVLNKQKQFESPALLLSSWPNILPNYQSPSVVNNIPLERQKKRIRVMRRMLNVKEFPVTSCSV